MSFSKEDLEAMGYKQKSLKSLNHNEGKDRPSLILKDMKSAFKEVLKVREMGAKKYDRLNWAESIGTDHQEEFLQDNIDSIYRHLIALEDEELDSESQCHHLAHVAVRAMMGIEYYAAKNP